MPIQTFYYDMKQLQYQGYVREKGKEHEKLTDVLGKAITHNEQSNVEPKTKQVFSIHN